MSGTGAYPRQVGIGREGGAEGGDLGPHGGDLRLVVRGLAGSGRSGRPTVCISAGPMPAVVWAAVPRRRPEVRKGERGSSGMVLRLQVMPARSSTSWASLPVSSASKGRRSTSSMWLSVPPDTRRKPSAGERPAEGGGVGHDLGGVGAELGPGRLGEGHRLGRDDVLERATLEPGEDRAVDLLGQVGAAQDGAAAGAAQRLVGGEASPRRPRPTGLGCTPPAMSPAGWAASNMNRAPTESAISRNGWGSMMRA